MGRLMENAVFLELKRMQDKEPSVEICYYKGRGEVDFVVRKGPKTEQLIQVCYEIEDARTKKRS